jgi:hypothetical protein
MASYPTNQQSWNPYADNTFTQGVGGNLEALIAKLRTLSPEQLGPITSLLTSQNQARDAATASGTLGYYGNDEQGRYNVAQEQSTLNALQNNRLPQTMEDSLRATMSGNRQRAAASLGGGSGTRSGTIAGALNKQASGRQDAQTYAQTRDQWSENASSKLEQRSLNRGRYGTSTAAWDARTQGTQPSY